MKKTHLKQVLLRVILFSIILLLFVGCNSKGVDQVIQLGEPVDSVEDSLSQDQVVGSEDSSVSSLDVDEESPLDEIQDEFIYIFISGAIHEPGVYEVQLHTRIYEVIRMAGGLLDTADPHYVNQALPLSDGERIYIPTLEETQSTQDGILCFENRFQGDKKESTIDSSGDSTSRLVNINTAGIDELKTLTGIGDVRAKSIVRYREKYGLFRSIEDLMQVEGIKEGTFRKIVDDITI